MASTKVLFIVGFARSGTTLIGNLLGEYDGVCHVGEARMLWRRDLAQTGPPCGCGRLVQECDWWRAVVGDFANQVSAPDGPIGKHSMVMQDASLIEIGRAMAGLQKSAEASLGFRRHFGSTMGRHKALATRYSSTQGQLYLAIARTAKSGLIVDSSKRPVHAEIMLSAPNLDPYVLHIVRDPRGVVHSRQQKRDGPSRSHSSRAQVVSDAIKWLQRNLLAERVRRLYGEDRSMFLRYEDFTQDPQVTVESILSTLGEPLDGSPFIGRDLAMMGPNHVSGGNRNRFARGRLEIRQDLRWKQGLRPLDRTLVTMLTSRGLLRYGYPLRGSPLR